MITKTIKKSNAKRFLPKLTNSEKIIGEVVEHFNFIKWSMKRIVLPLIIFYFIAGLFFGEHVISAAFTALVVFFYATFLPDLDAFFPGVRGKNRTANSLEKRLALFFTPIVIYYMLSRKAKPLSLGHDKAFHNKRSLAEFSAFLFVFGLVLYFSVLKAFFLALFGFLGFLTHLLVDKQLKFDGS